MTIISRPNHLSYLSVSISLLLRLPKRRLTLLRLPPLLPLGPVPRRRLVRKRMVAWSVSFIWILRTRRWPWRKSRVKAHSALALSCFAKTGCLLFYLRTKNHGLILVRPTSTCIAPQGICYVLPQGLRGGRFGWAGWARVLPPTHCDSGNASSSCTEGEVPS